MPRDPVKAKVWREAYRVRQAKSARHHYARNRDRVIKRHAPYLKEYYAAHAEALRQRSREWYRKHRSRALARSKVHLQRWRREHPEEVQAQTQRRLARVRGLPNTLTVEQWGAIKRAYGFRCAYCGKKKPLTQDHVVPAFHGGGYTPDNIVPACGPCNSSKGTRPPPVIPAVRLLL